MLALISYWFHNARVKAEYKHKELVSCADVKLIIWHKSLTDIRFNI